MLEWLMRERELWHAVRLMSVLGIGLGVLYWRRLRATRDARARILARAEAIMAEGDAKERQRGS